jgi:hypothetical protein
MKLYQQSKTPEEMIMISSSATRSLIKQLILMGTLLLTSTAVGAQPAPVDVSIISASAIQLIDRRMQPNEKKPIKGWVVYVTYSKGFDRSDGLNDAVRVHDASNFRILNASTGAFVPVSSPDLDPVGGASNNRVRMIIPSPEGLNGDDAFYLFTPNLLFNGAPAEAVPMHEIEIQKDADDNAGIKSEESDAIPEPAWGLVKSKGRDDSDVYVSYELTTARDTATTGTGDVKVAIPFFANFWSRTSKFSPFVDLKASSNEKADADSLKFGLEWFLPVHVGQDPNARWPYTAVDLINSGKIEAPKNFDNVNAIWEMRWLFPSSHFPWNGKNFRMFLDPYVGTEIGKNLKSPLEETEGKGLVRAMAGANFTVQIPARNLVALKGFEFTSAYIRRWPLKRELTIDKDADGNLVSLVLNKGPKDYSDSKFIIKISDYFGPYIGYEWGRLPPNYELVDHKWTFGILFKSKVRAGG